MEIKAQVPITVYVEKMGAILLTNKQHTGDRTKHMDMHYHLTHEYVEDGMVKI